MKKLILRLIVGVLVALGLFYLYLLVTAWFA